MCNTTQRPQGLELGGLYVTTWPPNSTMSDVSYKDFDILSEQDKAEALALINRYDQLEKQDSSKNLFPLVRHSFYLKIQFLRN